MPRKIAMIEQSQIWSIPFDYKGECGVLLAKLSPDRVALYTMNGWNVMSLDCWNQRFVTEFPLMCPFSEGSPGWCIIPEVIVSNGHRMIHAITAEVLEDALHDHVADLRLAGFKLHTLQQEHGVTEAATFFGKVDPKLVVVERGLNHGDLPTVRVAQPKVMRRRQRQNA